MVESQSQLQMRGFELFNFWPKFCFLGLSQSLLASIISKFFTVSQPLWPTFLPIHPHHKKACYEADLYVHISQLFLPS